MPFEGCSQNGGFGEASLMELMAVKAEQRRTPLNMHVELTYRCNEQCVHCYCVVEHGKEAEAAKRELTYEEHVRLLDELADMGSLYLTFSGGEVLVRRDFFDIVEHARRRNFTYRVYTNGIGLTEARAKRLAALDPLTVELSIFSADPAAHDAITRVPGSFTRMMAAVHRLKAEGVRVYLKTVVMKPNAAHLDGVRALARELDVFSHTFTCDVSPRIDGDIHGPSKFQLTEDELVEVYQHEALKKYAEADVFNGTPREVANQRTTCGPAVNGGCVDPYGNVFPCIAFRVPMGNLRQKSFRDIWEGPPPAIRDLLAVQHYSDLTECSSCELVGYCTRCHGDNLLERGPDGDWKACHRRARTIAAAKERLYHIITKAEAAR
jgi:radical SAM protein with 4Fe4S-binding SPASM domain